MGLGYPTAGVQVWKQETSGKLQLYLTHGGRGNVPQVKGLGFCPYEDILGVGHREGLSFVLIPGSGEPNFDSFVANPYETKKQRREGEIRQLLDKLAPETIVLNPEEIGGVKKTPRVGGNLLLERKKGQKQAIVQSGQDNEEEDDGEENEDQKRKKEKEKNKKKGRNKASKRYKKKQGNIIQEARDKARTGGKPKKRPKTGGETGIRQSFGSALDRFKVKRDS